MSKINSLNINITGISELNAKLEELIKVADRMQQLVDEINSIEVNIEQKES